MGSGFYESAAATHADAVPKVIDQIVSCLQGDSGGPKYLTKWPCVDIFVNPFACQAVSQSLVAINERKWWCVRPAADPVRESQNRSLHAKFIYSAFCREDIDTYSSGWLYLGSGNLTSAGFAQRAAVNAGNLEAGVLLAVEKMDSKTLQQRLPVQWDTEVEQGKPEAGANMEERETSFVAAPVAYFLYSEDTNCWLTPYPPESSDFEVRDSNGSWMSVNAQGRINWSSTAPLSVNVRWKEGHLQHEADVPVMDQHGRLCARPLRPLVNVEEVWWQLEDFPSTSEDGTPDEEALDGRGLTPNGGEKKAPSLAASYPIRAMMQLLENIAAKQTQLHQADWSTWCNRLEQTLVQAKDTEAVLFCRALDLNVLGPLWHPPFRPAYAENEDTLECQRYKAALGRIQAAWGMSDLAKLGDYV